MVMFDKLNHLGSFQDKNDGTIKAVYDSSDGVIETTLINNKNDRGMDVYCAPTHHYCNLGCKMCHLTKEGVQKKMIPIGVDSLVEGIVRTAHEGCYSKNRKLPLLRWSRLLTFNFLTHKNEACFKPHPLLEEYTFGAGCGGHRFSDAYGERRSENKKCLISFMGVGEPLLNLDLLEGVFSREDEFKKFTGYDNISYAISTIMPNHFLKSFGKKVCKNKFPLKVHFSMHSPFSKERFELLPGTKVSNEDALEMLCNYRQSVEKVLDIVENLKEFHCERFDPVEVHYTLIRGVNDSDKHLNKLGDFLEEFKIPIKFLRFNPVADLKRSLKTDRWIDTLRERVPEVMVREYVPPGHHVGSSCGEFTKHYYHSDLESDVEGKEFEEWKREYQIEEGKR